MIQTMPRRISAALVTAAVALLAAGCGSGSSSTSSTASSSTPATQSTPAAPTQPGAATTLTRSTGGERSAPPTSTSGDNSIQTYGSAASVAEGHAISSAAFSFFHALASSDYKTVCADLSAADRQRLLGSVKVGHSKISSCSKLLANLHFGGTAESRAAAAGTLSAVRVGGDDAFVLFQPKGGKPRYYVMKREGGIWRPVSLVPGVPLNP